MMTKIINLPKVLVKLHLATQPLMVLNLYKWMGDFNNWDSKIAPKM
ncbi:MAG: hypothetical protein U0T36_12275 [Saprospiraceae bacterium]